MARELFLRLRWFLALAVAAAAHSHDGDALSDSYAARNADVDPEEEAGECGCSKSRADAAGSCAAESRADAAGVCAADAAAPMPASPASAPAASASAASASAASFAASLAALAPAPPARLQRVVRLPAGARARLGTDAPHFSEDGEAPSFEFALPAPLWVDVYEVTNARWAAFVRATGHVSDAEKYGWSFVHEQAVPPATLATIEQAVQGADWWVPVANASWAAPEGPGTSAAAGRWDHPAVHVSRRDAAAFCGWAGGRLPTEDEWELAARGGKAARLFPWGDALTPRGEHRANIWQGAFPRGNSREDGFNWTAPVDALPPQNAFGLHHVVGNVWEWTATQWCPGGGAAAARGAVPGARRVAPGCGRRTRADLARVLADEGEVDYVKKGGSFMCHRDSCYRYRAAARDKNTANSSAANLGARCVYDARPPWAEGSDAPPQAAAAAAGGGGSKGRAAPVSVSARRPAARAPARVLSAALVAALAALAATVAHARWVVAWEDDFSGPSVNASLWNVATNASEGSNQIELYTADNVFLSDGALVLRTRPQNVTVGGVKYNVTSGRVDTRSLANVTAPFRVEVSARLQNDAHASGIHTAHWLLGYDCWPRGGEIDIMEMQSPGNEYSACNRTKWPAVTSNYHIGSGACSVETRHTTGTSAWPRAPTPGVDFSAYYTRYWTELNATDLIMGVNDTVVNHVYQGMPGWAAPFSLPTWPMYALITQAYMARRPCGDPAPDDFPIEQHVDYVRAWSWVA